jgi:hypothetical protein
LLLEGNNNVNSNPATRTGRTKVKQRTNNLIKIDISFLVKLLPATKTQ